MNLLPLPILPLVLLLGVMLGTAPLTYLYDRNASLPARLAFGAVAGMTLLGLFGYLLAAPLGLSTATVCLAALPLLSPLLLLRRPGMQRLLRRDVRRLRPRRGSGTRRAYIPVAFTGAMLLTIFFAGAMYERDGAIWTANHHNPGDLTWHLSIIQGFAVGENFPPEHPEFAGTRLTYPFLVDFIAAQFVVVGASRAQALFLQNVTLAFALLILLHTWALRITRNRLAFLITPTLIFLNGGWGWLNLINDARERGVSFLSLLSRLPHDVTINDTDLRWGNLLTTLLGTQRGFLLALPLAVIVFGLLWQGMSRDDRERLPRMTAAGLITGLLPLAHGHSFLVLLLAGVALALYDIPRARYRWRGWLAYFVLAAILALPQLRILAESTAVKPGSFLGAGWGWESCATELKDWALFWYRNTGPLFLLLFLALLWRPGVWKTSLTPRLKRYFLPFALCFALGNAVRLAPWMWDNIKVLFYVQLGAAPLVAALLGTFWRRGGFGRLLVPLLLFLLTFSGGLDIWRIVSGQSAAPIYRADAVAFARLVARHTPPESRILSSSQENHPVLLAGRRVLGGSMARLWSHGLNYDARLEEVKRIYGGAPDADRLLHTLRVSYIVVGPEERGDGTMGINDAYLARFPVVAEVGPYRLLQAR
jgi:hypothetical protein